jgi:hypothetical protein
VTDGLLQDSTDDNSVQDRWLQWLRLSMKHRLLVSCYLLDSRRSPMLAGDQKSPSFHVDAGSLHFPSHQTLWEAQDARQWWNNVQEYSMMPRCILEATVGRIAGCYDTFQSSILIEALWGPFSDACSRPHSTVEHLLSEDAFTQQQLAITKLVQLVPLRALLAVSGESWIFGTKVTSQEEFADYRAELQTWISQLWSVPISGNPQAATKALQQSVLLLTQSLETQELLKLSLCSKLGLFYASLVLWAATAATSSRVVASSFLSQQPVRMFASTFDTTAYAAGQLAFPPSTGQLAVLQQGALSIPQDWRSSIPHAEIIADSSHFLATAVEDIASLNAAACQVGCKSLLLWTKMQLHGVHSNAHAPAQEHGELINEAVGQIERLLKHEWENWGI